MIKEFHNSYKIYPNSIKNATKQNRTKVETLYQTQKINQSKKEKKLKRLK